MTQPTSRCVETPLQCSTDKFYNFFKKQANKLPEVCGSIVQKIELADGTESWVATVGSRKRIYFQSSDSSENIKDEVADIKDDSKKISFKVLEGAMLQYYNRVRFTLEVTVASTAKWTVEFEKKTESSPEPDAYLKLFGEVNTAVNTYLRYNP